MKKSLCLFFLSSLLILINSSTLTKKKDVFTDITQNNDSKCYVQNCLKCLPQIPFGCQNCQQGEQCCSDYCSVCSKQDPTVCLECDEGYLYNETTKVCVMQNSCQQTHCLICNQNICRRCHVNTALNPFSFRCEQCTDYCEKCEIHHNCLKCIETRLLINNTCQLCGNNCRICQGTVNNCTGCHLGSYLINNTCLPCEYPCLWCQSLQNCTHCDDTYFINNDLVCQKCHVNCRKCINQSYCQVCQSFYILDEDKYQCEKCQQIFTGCAKCVGKSKQNATCTVCYPQYVLINDTHCDKCPFQCQTCFTQKLCKKCKSGYTFDENKECKPCKIMNCLLCLTTKVCNFCQLGFFWDDFDPNAQAGCKSCIEGCSSCSINYCTSCQRGYYLYNKTCLKCKDNCRTCEKRSDYCTSCTNGYYAPIYHNDCVKCPLNCLTCNSYQKCSKCVSGYRNNLITGKCIQCSIPFCTYCRIAQNGQQQCEQCLNSKYLYDNKCEQCPQYCQTCQNSRICYWCQDRTTLVQKTGTCIPCSQNCKACEYINNYISCRECDIGYYQVKSDTDYRFVKCEKCPQNCNYCNKTVCQECVEGFFLYEYQICKKCEETCEICQSLNHCESCIHGYYRTQQLNCQLCPKSCKMCAADDYCTECHPTFYLTDDQKCLKCSLQHCSSCDSKNPEICERCLETYVPEYTETDSHTDDFRHISVCYKCGEDKLKGCETCASSSKCVTCIEDYELNANRLCIAQSFKMDYSAYVIVICCLSAVLAAVSTSLICKWRKGRQSKAPIQPSLFTEHSVIFKGSDKRDDSEGLIKEMKPKKGLQSSQSDYRSLE